MDPAHLDPCGSWNQFWILVDPARGSLWILEPILDPCGSSSWILVDPGTSSKVLDPGWILLIVDPGTKNNRFWHFAGSMWIQVDPG